MEYSSAFVCLMGLGTVFFGLICLILLTKVMGALCRSRETPAPAVPAVSPAGSTPEPNRQELVAAVSAAIAEELGTDITGIRILSVKKI